MACGVPARQPGTEPAPHAVEDGVLTRGHQGGPQEAGSCWCTKGWCKDTLGSGNSSWVPKRYSVGSCYRIKAFYFICKLLKMGSLGVLSVVILLIRLFCPHCPKWRELSYRSLIIWGGNNLWLHTCPAQTWTLLTLWCSRLSISVSGKLFTHESETESTFFANNSWFTVGLSTALCCSLLPTRILITKSELRKDLSSWFLILVFFFFTAIPFISRVCLLYLSTISIPSQALSSLLY